MKIQNPGSGIQDRKPAKLFRIINLAENAGFGFGKMESGWMQFSKRKPLIEQGINFTRIEFIFSQKGGQKPLLSKRQIEILGMLKEASSVSRKSLAAAFEINESAIQKHLDALKTKGVIERKGASRGGQWVIKEQ